MINTMPESKSYPNFNLSNHVIGSPSPVFNKRNKQTIEIILKNCSRHQTNVSISSKHFEMSSNDSDDRKQGSIDF